VVRKAVELNPGVDVGADVCTDTNPIPVTAICPPRTDNAMLYMPTRFFVSLSPLSPLASVSLTHLVSLALSLSLSLSLSLCLELFTPTVGTFAVLSN